ncbi:enoyl-CoA hydratase [Kurthia massiliensis]|uniref:enoyl-CoA hydratase n=1 Tax=Kurthia massiliensis TaxID=1033739 RepID=UPI000289079A|nr:enoyl-CoA hydratase [Kurthia massiliensis]
MSFLQLSKEGAISVITINRPPANAMSYSLIIELDELFDQIAKDEETRVVVIHGEGRFFSAGADIKEFTQVSEQKMHDQTMSVHKIFRKIETFEKPVIAAIHGAALGGGLELAMSCHIRYVASNAKLGLPELNLGLIPGYGGTQRLPSLVGLAKAAELMFTSESLTGEEAVQWGLANAHFPEAELRESVLAKAHKIAEKSPIALKSAIDLLRLGDAPNLRETLEAEAQHFAGCFKTEDAKEGITAFVEKRKPVFKGQ